MKSAVATARSRIYLKHHEKAQKKPTRSLQWICRQFKGIDDLLDHYNARDILEAGLLIWEVTMNRRRNHS